jgi:Flp pilus assembly protein TadG
MGRSEEATGVWARIPGVPADGDAKAGGSLDFMARARTMKNLRDERGQTVVFVAVFMGLLALGFVAFALDVGVLFREKRMAQSAAQAAAVAAAEEVGYGNTANKQAVANAMAKLNGFDTTLASNPATVTLTTPASGNFTGSIYVQATVSMPIHTTFLGAFAHGMVTMPVSATAIAGGGVSSQTCVCTNGTITMSGASKLIATGCGIFDNSSSSSSIAVSGGSTLTAASFASAATGWSLTGSGNIINIPTADIFSGVQTSCSPTLPAVPTYTVSSCITDPGSAGGTHTFGPSSASGVICYKGLTLGANSGSSTLNPGTYVIYGNYLTFDAGTGGHSNLGGNGVFFYLTNGAELVVQGGANVNLVSGGATEAGGSTAPTVGVYNGVLVFQDPADTAVLSFQGGSTTYMNGAIIAPSAAVTIENGSGATTKGGLVSTSLTIEGGGTVTAITDTNEGSLAVYSSKPKLVQ